MLVVVVVVEVVAVVVVVLEVHCAVKREPLMYFIILVILVEGKMTCNLGNLVPFAPLVILGFR